MSDGRVKIKRGATARIARRRVAPRQRPTALTHRQVAVLISRVLEANSAVSKRAFAKKLKRVIDWATLTLVGSELLRMVLEGELEIIVHEKKALGFRASRAFATTEGR